MTGRWKRKRDAGLSSLQQLERLKNAVDSKPRELSLRVAIWKINSLRQVCFSPLAKQWAS
jgi:hypothetical protein